MTQARAPMTIDNALARIAGQIGWAEMAHAVSEARGTLVAERTVRDWGDPATGRSIRLDDAIVLDLAFRAKGGVGAPIHETYSCLVDTAGGQQFACQVQLAERTAVAITEAGQAYSALIRASMPGATTADKVEAVREWEEAVAALGSIGPVIAALLAESIGRPP
ncbi:hypothetical protein ASE78_05535 [Sphingomonas sp. Leaf25]|nr:hypothetical protein ASE78_05535 [Sphingomonas sp. Leaf25]